MFWLMSVDVWSCACAHDVSVTDGYSADNTFSHADPGWSHKEFNISGSLVFGTTFSILTRPFSVLLTTTSNVLLILFMEMFMKSSNNKLNANRKLQNCMQRSWTMLGMLASWTGRTSVKQTGKRPYSGGTQCWELGRLTFRWFRRFLVEKASRNRHKC